MMDFARKYSLSSFYFQRGMGLVYFLAFYSVFLEWEGLVGKQGILPYTQYLSALKNANYSFLKVPVILNHLPWDIGLGPLIFIGLIASVALAFNCFSLTSSILCYLSYLCLVHLGGSFFSFQWDILLLEVGLLLPFFIGFQVRFRIDTLKPPPIFPLFILWIILFKLMLSSGLVKIFAGGTWADLSALEYHFFTQPIPNPLAYYLHFLPPILHKISCLIMFAIELLIPFLLLIPGRIQKWGAYFVIAFMILIQVSGNYTFFNLLTIILAVGCIQDRYLPWVLKDPFRSRIQSGSIVYEVFLAVFLFPLPFFHLLHIPLPGEGQPGLAHATVFVKRFKEHTQPFFLANSYGLFAHMTTKRYEIEIQGSMDGRKWKPYVFPCKPGPLERSLPIIAPMQPRLDWQMWFAALRPRYANQVWFRNLIVRLLEHNKQTLSLFEEVPFERAPRSIRALYYEYEFSKEKKYWKRKLKGMYLPPVSLNK